MEIAIALAGMVVGAFLVYLAGVLRERRRPPAPQVKGPVQRHMEDGSL